MPGLTTGTLDAVSRAPDIIRIGGVPYQVADTALLRGLAVGMRITVSWDQVEGHRRARRIELPPAALPL